MNHPLRLERADRLFVGGPASSDSMRTRRRLPRWQVLLFAFSLLIVLLDGIALAFAPLFVSAYVEMALIGILGAAMVVLVTIVRRAALIRDRRESNRRDREAN